jgi:GNAT superfamily N-acetyltransferase
MYTILYPSLAHKVQATAPGTIRVEGGVDACSTEAIASAPAATTATLPGGAQLLVRPAWPKDRAPLIRMYYRLSPNTIYRWLFVCAPHTPHWAARLGDLAAAPSADRSAYVALHADEIVGIAHYVRTAESPEAEMAMIIDDAWQGRGLGRALLACLAEAALARRVTILTAEVQGDNRRALGVLAALFGERTLRWSSGVCRLRIHARSLKRGQCSPLRQRRPGEIVERVGSEKSQ